MPATLATGLRPKPGAASEGCSAGDEIAIAEADRRLESYRGIFPEETVPLSQAAGRVLREPIAADRPYPPLDVVRMDGVAIAYRVWESGAREFPIAGLAKAGEARQILAHPSGCIEVMTGAPCPEGCDTVIPYEEIRRYEGRALAHTAHPRPGQHVDAGGSQCDSGQVLVAARVRLTAPRLAVAASVGKSALRVTRLARIAVVATGDELVEVETAPLPHQIRLSNPFGLGALLRTLAEIRVETAGDDPARLSELFGRCLESADMLLVTGGVSAGKLDFVPEVLGRLGVKPVFHRLAQKPGKPLWFGVSPAGQPVFGLPGNPVSALVCARRFVVPLLQFNSGLNPFSPVPQIRLAADIRSWERGTLFVPVALRAEEAGWLTAVPQPTQGSGDFTRLGDSDGFVEIPAGRGVVRAGEAAPYYAWEI